MANESKNTTTSSSTGASATKRKVPIFPIIIAALIVVIASLIVGFSLRGSTKNLEVSDLTKDAESYLGERVKIQGTIAGHWTEKNSRDIFIQLSGDTGEEVVFHYTKPLPDPYQKNRIAIAEGVFIDGIRIDPKKVQDREQAGVLLAKIVGIPEGDAIDLVSNPTAITAYGTSVTLSNERKVPIPKDAYEKFEASEEFKAADSRLAGISYTRFIEGRRLTVKCPSKYVREGVSPNQYEEYKNKYPEHVPQS
ncbi:MAG: hypothetical protein CMH54_06640 [Myxococcales bacterium]|nr:hypothetical protein [Myxococcales bacterium]